MRKRLIGTVTSDKNSKTRRVEVKRLFPHPKYGKIVRGRTVCHVHDENNDSHEGDTVEKKEWTQKVINAVVRAQIYASQNKKEAARLMSKDGEGFLPMPAEVVERAMTLYTDEESYEETGAIKHAAEWGNGRIDFQPWPYPSATKLIVEEMNKTVVGGDTTFLNDLDPQFVADDLVNYDFVRNALEKYPEWKDDPSESVAGMMSWATICQPFSLSSS